MTKLILNANIVAIIYMAATFAGVPGLTGGILETAAVACIGSLVYEAAAHGPEERAPSADALAFAAAAGVLAVGAIATGTSMKSMALNAAALTGVAAFWASRGKDGKRK